MKTRFEKIMKIASELLSYCHHHGAKELHLDIFEEKNAVLLNMRACLDDMPKDRLEYLSNALNTPRQREVEQDYWELIGESEDFAEMQLLGMLCDDATVDYTGQVLSITLKRHD